MDSALSTLGFVIFGFSFSIYAFLVESHLKDTSFAITSPPPFPLPPPPPPPSPSLSHRSHHSPPPSHNHNHSIRPNHDKHTYRRPPPPPPSSAHQMNGGKKIGLLFAGIAGIMQIGVAGFLVFKRRQLLKTKDKDAFEIGS